MSVAPECLDAYGREIPVDVAASVKWLKGMGYDDAAEALRNGWHGRVPDDSGAS